MGFSDGSPCAPCVMFLRSAFALWRRGEALGGFDCEEVEEMDGDVVLIN